MITQEKLKRLFHYDSRTGIFTEKTKRKNKNIGDILGTVDKRGYLVGVIDKKQYKLHRLAYLYMTGIMPDKVDHENHIVSDNRWCNLRNASSFDNMQNLQPDCRLPASYVHIHEESMPKKVQTDFQMFPETSARYELRQTRPWKNHRSAYPPF